MTYTGPIHFVKDLYWCGIPLYCRHCPYLKKCRKGWRQGRKCYNGCIKLKEIEQDRILRQMSNEDLERLLRREQDKEGAPDDELIRSILCEFDRRGNAPWNVEHIDIDAAWNDFVENYLNSAEEGEEDAFRP